MNNNCLIVVPAYALHLNNWEYVSFSRCCKILGNEYDICLLTYKELDITEYASIADKYNINLKRCNRNKEYFKSTYMYCVQMLDPLLYANFENYKYSLIYHLDCYIFKNNLQEWIDKNYPQCECVAIGWSATSVPHVWFNGEGLRNNDMVIKCLDENYEAANNVKSLMLIMQYLNEQKSDLGKEWVMYKSGEDIFFTDHLSNYNIKDEFLKFGWSVNVLNIINCPEKYGIPTMIHNFEPGYDWIIKTIGNPDENIEECINKNF